MSAAAAAAEGGAPDPLAQLLAAYPTGLLLLRERLAASGAFLLPWAIGGCVRQGHKVVVITAAYSPAKYQAALKKLGISASSSSSSSSSSMQQQQQTSVAFVSPAAAFSQVQQQQQQQQQPASPLQALFQQVHDAAQQLLKDPPQQQQQLTVVLDSLACVSALSAAGEAAHLQALLHQLTALGELLQVPQRLLVLAADDIGSQQPLLRWLASRAHVTADIHPLEGKTAALDGSLTVALRRAAPRQQTQQQQQHVPDWLAVGGVGVWWFRVGDVAVKWVRQVQGRELLGA